MTQISKANRGEQWPAKELPQAGPNCKWFVLTYTGTVYYQPDRQNSASTTVSLKILANKLEDATIIGRFALEKMVGEDHAQYYTLQTAEQEKK